MTPQIETIQRVVAESHSIPLEAMASPRRARCWARPRMIAMYLSQRMVPAVSLPQIGQAFGNRDHTTVMNAVRVISQARHTDLATRMLLEDLERQLRPHLRTPRTPPEADTDAARAEDLARRIARDFTCGMLRIARKHPGPFLRHFMSEAIHPGVRRQGPPPAGMPLKTDPWPGTARFDR